MFSMYVHSQANRIAGITAINETSLAPSADDHLSNCLFEPKKDRYSQKPAIKKECNDKRRF